MHTFCNRNFAVGLSFHAHHSGKILFHHRIYTNKCFFAGLVAYNLIPGSLLKNTTYNNVYNSVVLYFGWIPGAKKDWL